MIGKSCVLLVAEKVGQKRNEAEAEPSPTNLLSAVDRMFALCDHESPSSSLGFDVAK